MLVRLRSLGALALALATVSCDAPTVPEETFDYNPRLPGGFVYHWPAGATISIYVDPSVWPPETDPVAAVRQAFARWREVVHYQDFGLRIVGDPAIADVIVHYWQADPIVDLSECGFFGGSASGVTAFCPTESGDELEVLPLLTGPTGRVKMNVTIGGDGFVGQDHLLPYVTHEVGHILGIGGHSADSRDLMYNGALTVARPTERDARTLRWVLRQPADIRP